MGLLSNMWEAAKAVGKGVAQVFVGIGEVLILAIFAIGYVLFSIVEHLYNWIDSMIEKIGKKIKSAFMLSPEDTEKFIKSLPPEKRTVLPPYKPGVKRTIMAAADDKGKVYVAQIASTEKGFEQQIEEAFQQGHLIEQPIEI